MEISVPVLINTCYGGFSFSDDFLIEIFKIYGPDDRIFKSRPATEYDLNAYSRENVIHISSLKFKVIKNNYGEVYDYVKNMIYFINKDEVRFHPGIHAIYLRLGGSEYCSGMCSSLELVDIKYEIGITEFDGLEDVIVNRIR